MRESEIQIVYLLQGHSLRSVIGSQTRTPRRNEVHASSSGLHQFRVYVAILARFVGMARHAGRILHSGKQFVLGGKICPVVFLWPQRDKICVAGFTIV